MKITIELDLTNATTAVKAATHLNNLIYNNPSALEDSDVLQPLASQLHQAALNRMDEVRYEVVAALANGLDADILNNQSAVKAWVDAGFSVGCILTLTSLDADEFASTLDWCQREAEHILTTRDEAYIADLDKERLQRAKTGNTNTMYAVVADLRI